MDNIIVNWVKEDEELLEPYEWCSYDDLENIHQVDVYRVSEKVLYDFIYGCLKIQEEQYYNRIFIVSDTRYCVMVEIDSKGTLMYRGLTSYDSRKEIYRLCRSQEIVVIAYMKYDEGCIKEYGLTRQERLKKQYIETSLEELYVSDYPKFEQVCEQLEIQGDSDIMIYMKVKQKIEKGYTFLHEVLYRELIKTK